MDKIKCQNCGYEYNAMSARGFCPRCGTFVAYNRVTDNIKLRDGREICKVCGNRSNMSPINGMCWQCYNKAKLSRMDEGATSGVNSWQVVLSQRAAVPYLYASLRSVLSDAIHQAAFGKGKERHANDDPFERQSICEITRKHGLAFATGQAAKKLEESHRLLQLRGAEAAINEILGAINYAAAAVIVLREGEGE